MTATGTAPAGRYRTAIDDLSWTLSDIARIAGRTRRRLMRHPEQVMFSLISPIISTLLFRYVFGGAINGLDGVNYIDYLVPGSAAQSLLFSSGVTGMALVNDLQSGFVDRLRSLPMSRSAVFSGRVLADTLNNGLAVVILLAATFAIGFRPATVWGLLVGALLLLLFALSVSLGYALIGLYVRSVDAVNAVSFPIILPLTFASSAFVPVDTMPGWLQGFAVHQPVTVVINAARSLILGDTVTTTQRAALFNGSSTGALVGQALLWTLGIALVFGLLSARRYRSMIR